MYDREGWGFAAIRHLILCFPSLTSIYTQAYKNLCRHHFSYFRWSLYSCSFCGRVMAKSIFERGHFQLINSDYSHHNNEKLFRMRMFCYILRLLYWALYNILYILSGNNILHKCRYSHFICSYQYSLCHDLLDINSA